MHLVVHIATRPNFLDVHVQSWADPEYYVRRVMKTVFWSTEERTNLPREAIGPSGSNGFSRGVRTSTFKKPIATCDFSGGVRIPCTPLWIRLCQC